MKQLRQRTKINFLKEEPSKEAVEKHGHLEEAFKNLKRKRRGSPKYRNEIVADDISAHGNQQNVGTSNSLGW